MDLKSFIGSFYVGLISLSIQAHPGIGLVYDGDHTIYYTDLSHVWKLDTDTGEKSIYVENVHTHELALDAKGDLYGEHYWYEESEEQFWHYIWEKRGDGTFQKIRENREGENRDFSFTRDAEFNSYNIRVKGDEFEIIKNDSLSPEVWHTLALNRPGWRYMTDKGQLLFSDYPGIYRADSEHADVLVADLSSSRFPFSMQDKTHHIYGIWEDREGALYVALYGGRQVVRIRPDKEVERVLKTGLLWSPVNGVFDKNADLWLMEARMDGAVQIRKIEGKQLGSEGSFITENVMIVILLLLILGVILLLKKKMRRNTRLRH